MSKRGSITTSDYLSFEEYQRLVNNLAAEEEYLWCTYCILSFCTGLRSSDVRKLKWNQVLNVRGLTVTEKKTQKTKRIPIGENASEHLSTLYEKMGKPDPNSYIFVGKKSGTGKPITIQYVNRMLKLWKNRYNLEIENFSTHTFRKTFGRYVYEKSGRQNSALLYLNRIFRHHNLDTTMIYLGITDDEISGIFNSITI